MKKMIKQFLAILVLAPLAFSVLAQPARFVEGTHYTVLPTAVKTNDASKIEVVEVFWYGCPHCFTFEPLIEDFVAKAPADVDFVRFPAIWNDLMKIHAPTRLASSTSCTVQSLLRSMLRAIVLRMNNKSPLCSPSMVLVLTSSAVCSTPSQ